jgi:hypothetical protein
MYLTVTGTSTSHKKHCCLLTSTMVMRRRHNVMLQVHFSRCIFSGATAQIGPGSLTVEVSRSPSFRNTYTVGLLWMSDQIAVEAATCTTHRKQQATIWTREPLNKAVEDVRLWPHGQSLLTFRNSSFLLLQFFFPSKNKTGGNLI